MKRVLMVIGIIIAAALLGFVLWYGPWSAGWFSGKAWEWRDSSPNEDLHRKIPEKRP